MIVFQLISILWIFTVWLLSPCIGHAADGNSLPDTIEKVKPAVVAIGTFQKTRRPPSIFRGTGFVVADGLHVVTNAHVLPEKLDFEKREIDRGFCRQHQPDGDTRSQQNG